MTVTDLDTRSNVDLDEDWGVPLVSNRLLDLVEANMTNHGDSDYVRLDFMGEEHKVPFRRFDDEVEFVYRSGHCAFLALAIHEMTGLNFAVFTLPHSTKNSWSGHVAIETGPDEYLDICGTSTEADINRVYGYGPGTGRAPMELITASTLSEIPYPLFLPPVAGQPWTLLGELEELITRDYAKIVVRYCLR